MLAFAIFAVTFVVALIAAVVYFNPSVSMRKMQFKLQFSWNKLLTLFRVVIEAFKQAYTSQGQQRRLTHAPWSLP
jgi:hypothetical protein